MKFFQEYVYLQSTAAIKLSRELINNYKEYADKLINEPLKLHIIKLKPLASLERLTSIEKDRLLKVFINLHNGSKGYNDFIKNSDFLLSVFQFIHQIRMEGNGKSVIEMSNKVSSISNNILLLITQFLNNKDIKIDYLIRKKLTDLLEFYLNGRGKKPCVEWENVHLFIPLSSTLNTISDSFEIEKELIVLCNNGLRTIESIKEFNMFTAETSINDNLKKVNKACDDLEEIVNKLKQ